MFCAMCGALNDDDAAFCGNCGAALVPEQASAGGLMETSEEAAAELESELGAVEEFGDEVPPDEEFFLEPALAAGFDVAPPAAPQPVLRSTPPTSGLAVASLVLGVGGLTMLPLLGSVAAIILGYMARNDIRRRPDQISGDGLALAGIVMGWIAVGLAVLAVVLSLLGVGLGLCGFGLCGLAGSAG